VFRRHCVSCPFEVSNTPSKVTNLQFNLLSCDVASRSHLSHMKHTVLPGTVSPVLQYPIVMQ
jgi:hypothetical protein